MRDAQFRRDVTTARAAVAEERERIVAWLRASNLQHNHLAADAIERGDHLSFLKKGDVES